MRVLMLVQSTVAGDARVLREASTLAEAGHAVHVVGRDVPAGFDAGRGVTVASVTRSRGLGSGSGGSTGRGAAGRPATRVAYLARRSARWLLLPEHRERVEARWRSGARELAHAAGPFDLVHAHDFNTLALAVALARSWDVPYVYDSHELWFGRAQPGRPTPLWRLRGRRREARLAAGAAVVFTVSDGIAARLRSSGADVRVVRNSFPLPNGSAARSQVPLERPAGLAYAGRIGPGRDLETVTAAASALAPLRTVVAGPLEPGYRLDRGSVEVRPAMSLDDVDGLYRELGIAVVTLTDTCDNHRLALPNKLFHAIRAGVPVVAADLPELRAVVRHHELGRLYRPGDAASLTEAIRGLATDYRRYAQAVDHARPELSWERDARVLLEAYSALATA